MQVFWITNFPLDAKVSEISLIQTKLSVIEAALAYFFSNFVAVATGVIWG